MNRYSIIGHTLCGWAAFAPLSHTHRYCPHCHMPANRSLRYAPLVVDVASGLARVKTIRVGQRVMTPGGEGVASRIVRSNRPLPEVFVEGDGWYAWEDVCPISKI